MRRVTLSISCAQPALIGAPGRHKPAASANNAQLQPASVWHTREHGQRQNINVPLALQAPSRRDSVPKKTSPFEGNGCTDMTHRMNLSTASPTTVKSNSSEEDYRSRLTWGEDVAIGSYLAVVGLLAIAGNSFVLAVWFKRRRSMKAPELFAVNLAVVDLLIALCCNSFQVTSRLDVSVVVADGGVKFCLVVSDAGIAASFNHGWMLGNPGCQGYAFLRTHLGTTNILTIIAHALARYIKVCHTKHSDEVNFTNVRRTLAAVWTIALFWSTAPLYGWGAYSTEPSHITCGLDVDQVSSSAANQSYVFFLVLVFIVAPVGAIAFSYIKIIQKVRGSHRRTFGRGRRVARKAQLERKLSKTAIMVGLGFLMAWTPYAILGLWCCFAEPGRSSPLFTAVPALFVRTAGVYNPIIYLLLNDTFRMEAYAITTGTIRKKITRKFSGTVVVLKLDGDEPVVFTSAMRRHRRKSMRKVSRASKEGGTGTGTTTYN
ncbi:RRH [Branchiostoma lanceolatum]|uniref:RRH protein n=1 Tax=Branchiostoma lanceolatum TaxID=7740 RepID=A0A8J9ZLR7_BRALA|nr:RRH [Branchiostoma lanceolatum]